MTMLTPISFPPCRLGQLRQQLRSPERALPVTSPGVLSPSRHRPSPRGSRGQGWSVDE